MISSTAAALLGSGGGGASYEVFAVAGKGWREEGRAGCLLAPRHNLEELKSTRQAPLWPRCARFNLPPTHPPLASVGTPTNTRSGHGAHTTPGNMEIATAIKKKKSHTKVGALPLVHSLCTAHTIT